MTGAKKTIEKKQSNIPEIVIVITVTIAWIVLQVLSILQVDTSVLERSEYVVNSFVGKDAAIPTAEYGVAWIYMNILHMVFYVVGNHACAVLWLQFVLQLLSAVLLYRGLRKLLGRIVAVIFYLVVLWVPFFVIPIEASEPLWVAFFAATLVIYLLATLLHIRKKRKNGEVQSSKENSVVHNDMVQINMPGETQSADNVVTQTGTATEEKPKVKLLDNPLPGPKKHVSKVLDYDLQLEKMPRVFMRYDIKVAEDDDFDIK